MYTGNGPTSKSIGSMWSESNQAILVANGSTPSNHLSYQTPEKPFEVSEEDFRKTAMDYLMFSQGIDTGEFGEKLLDKVMYSSVVSTDEEYVTVTIEKKE